jgi:hypothetical protein
MAAIAAKNSTEKSREMAGKRESAAILNQNKPNHEGILQMHWNVTEKWHSILNSTVQASGLTHTAGTGPKIAPIQPGHMGDRKFPSRMRACTRVLRVYRIYYRGSYTISINEID